MQASSLLDQTITPVEILYGAQAEVNHVGKNGKRRNFSVTAIAEPEDPAGICLMVRDEDTDQIVTRTLRPTRQIDNPKSLAAILCVEAMATLNWSSFTELCLSASDCACDVIGIDTAFPHNRGKTRPATQIEDSRRHLPDIFCSCDLDPASDYRYPPLTSQMMQRELLARPFATAPDGSVTFSFNIRPQGNWNRTGRLPGIVQTNPSFDVDWRLAVVAGDMCQRAITAAIEAYICGPFEIFELGSEFECEMLCSQDLSELYLQRFGSLNLDFENRKDMGERLQMLTEREIVQLWAVLRTLDVDLNPEALKAEYAVHMADLRQAFEACPPDLSGLIREKEVPELQIEAREPLEKFLITSMRSCHAACAPPSSE